MCFKVRGKIFTIVDLSKGKQAPICFKCAPEKFYELLEVDGITPAPYVGRYKWVLVERAGLLPSEELKDLIRQSYDLVVAKAPKKTAVRKRRSSKPRRSS